MTEKTKYIAGLYCRLSKDDEQSGESVSIGTQRSILTDYCQNHGYAIYKVYTDDGYSGLNFNRPGFKELLEDVERGAVNMVITKDLSRLGRDYIMTGYYSEMFFQAKGVRYIALADDVDSLKGTNELAPFKNILNEMYARDVSKKVKNAKRQRAKQGLFIGSQAPYGYAKDPCNRNQLIVDPEGAEVVSQIFSMALEGLGSVAIASELESKKIPTPAVYKYRHGDQRFARYPSIQNGGLLFLAVGNDQSNSDQSCLYRRVNQSKDRNTKLQNEEAVPCAGRSADRDPQRPRSNHRSGNI